VTSQPIRVLQSAARLFLVLGLAVALTGCGAGANGSPTSPGAAPVLHPGAYTLSITSAIGSFEPDAPCAARAGDRGNRDLGTRITITRESDGWLGRSSSAADGSLELRLREVGANQTGEVWPGVPVAGTVRGFALDARGPGIFGPRDVRVVARGVDSSPDAPFVGGLSNGISGIGTMTGIFTYTDGVGASTICRGALWVLFLYPPFSLP
jgi:hypothetical protein